MVATTTQGADLARQVAGSRAHVSSLLKPNSDPHGYEPRAGDVKALARADLVVRSGGEIDDWLEEAQAGAGSDAPVVTLGEHTDARSRTGGRTRAPRCERCRCCATG